MTGRNDPCWCGSYKKFKKCHGKQSNQIGKSPNKRLYYQNTYGIHLKTEEEIHKIRQACQLSAFILSETAKIAKAGVSTQELNDYAHELHKKHNAIPAPLNYGHPPFPRSICTSLNDEVCHGIPSHDIILKEGDILNIDVSPILNGYYGDCSRMVVIGNTTQERQLVTDTSYECLMKSIEILKPGVLVKEIGDIITNHAHKKNCSVVHQFVGHGVGVEFHEEPQIPHHKNQCNTPLEAGMIFTIEPMINAGVADSYIDTKNDWTAYTVDHKASAQWEHTLLITDTGYEILTPWSR